MELFLNDLSIHGQFPDIPAFRTAITNIMRMRAHAQQHGREIYCHKGLARVRVTTDRIMPQVIQSLELNEQRAIMHWLTRQGPFWDDVRVHSPDDYLECNGDVVTDSAVGEAAYCCLHGVERQLISIVPSRWEYSPVPVSWKLDHKTDRLTEVINHWTLEKLEDAIQAAPIPVLSWQQLAAVCGARFPNLSFLGDAFASLYEHPFVESASQRILALLHVLNEFRTCFDASGNRTQQGQRIYQNYFTGEKAWFSDSSDSEKRDFKGDLTFRDPRTNRRTLFCSWHGKVKTPQIRIHFSWPVPFSEPLYIAYVGEKITKR